MTQLPISSVHHEWINEHLPTTTEQRIFPILRPMSSKQSLDKLLFGLKVRNYRQKLGLSFAQLAEQSGLSVSYLNEIEKGKKFPRVDKLNDLAKALETTARRLSDDEYPASLQPVIELLKSNFLNELPLELFGIELSKVIEIIANAPARVGAFISALVDISKNYSIHEEHFYLGAMRAYQEMYFNYFEDIEGAIDEYRNESNWASTAITTSVLEKELAEKWGIRVIYQGLDKYPDLQQFRSVLVPREKKLLLRSGLSQSQIKYQLAKEIGFHVLDLNPRPYSSTVFRVTNFDEVLNNYRAGYFSVGMLVDRESMIKDIRLIFEKERWDPRHILSLLNKYKVNPEIVFQRFNVIPRFFGLQNVFFHRFVFNIETGIINLDKEYHFRRRHYAQIDDATEHYCRRWSSIKRMVEASGSDNRETILDAQIARFLDNGEEYLTVSATQKRTDNIVVSNTMGVQIDKASSGKIMFLNDSKIQRVDVSLTCQRCSVEDCEERAAEPSLLKQTASQKRIKELLDELTG